jgi:hypothetical protein
MKIMLRARLTFIVTVLLFMGVGQLHSQTETFTAFNVQPGQNRSVIIYWVIRPAIDSFDYVLQRSKDAKTWETIANPGFHLSHNYSHIDMHPAEGMNYYRVIQFRSKQQIGASDTKWIQVSNAGRLYMWPNPANDILHVRSPFVKGSMQVVSPAGQLMMKLSITNAVTDVPMRSLARGTYFIHVMYGKEILVERFIKQ